MKLRYLLLLILLAGIANASNITYVSSYDTDNITATNPLAGELVRSYLFNQTQVFSAAVAVHTEGIAENTTATLTVWNSTDSYTFNSTIDGYGYVGFAFILPYSSEGYQYTVEANGVSTQARKIDINATPFRKLEVDKVKWITTSSNITSFPFTVEAEANLSTILNATLTLVSNQSLETIPAEIYSRYLNFTLDDIPDGRYNASISVQTGEGLAISEVREINISTGKKLEAGESEVSFAMYVSRISPTKMKVMEVALKRETEDTPGEEVEFSLYNDPLADIYSFKITMNETKNETIVFTAYNKDNQTIYSSNKTVHFEANKSTTVDFVIPKSNLANNITHIKVKGPNEEHTLQTVYRTYDTILPDAVLTYGSANAVTPTGLSAGLTGGFSAVMDYKSGELSPYAHSGPMAAIGGGPSIDVGSGLIWVLDPDDGQVEGTSICGTVAVVPGVGFNGGICFLTATTPQEVLGSLGRFEAPEIKAPHAIVLKGGFSIGGAARASLSTEYYHRIANWNIPSDKLVEHCLLTAPADPKFSGFCSLMALQNPELWEKYVEIPAIGPSNENKTHTANKVCLNTKQEFTITNSGPEPISDLTVNTSGNLSFFITPKLDKFKILPGQQVTFTAYIIVDEDTPTTTGTITVTGANFSKEIPVTYYKPPEGGHWESSPEFGSDVYFTATVNSFICVNRPSFCVTLDLPGDINLTMVTEAYIIMNFDDRCSSAQAHDTYVYLNGGLVKTWMDSVTLGQYEFSVPVGNLSHSNSLCVNTENYKGGGHFCANAGNALKIKTTKYRTYCRDELGCNKTQDIESNFTDGLDNDCDGFIDCNDLDSCDSSVCNNSVLCPPRENCTDGIDNDGNGLIDWADLIPCPGNCSDGFRNGNEDGVDCGGRCSACISDLRVEKVEVSPENPDEGDNVSIKVTVSNAGNLPVYYVILTLREDGNPIASKEVAINPESNNTVEISTVFSYGIRNLVVDIDQSNIVNETNEGNNEHPIQVSVGGLPDLTPSDVLFPENMMEGNDIGINLTVRNLGHKNSDNFTVRISIGNFTDNGSLSIEENSSQRIGFNWTSVKGSHQVKIEIDPEGKIKEVDEDNNNLSKVISVSSTPRVAINEIMYDLPGSDSGREWIEIYNYGEETNITGWRLEEDSTQYNLNLIQGSMLLPKGGYAVIADNADQFLLEHTDYAGTLIDSSFSLSNSGETIMLRNGFDADIIDSLTYDSSWGADGNGYSLERISPSGDSNESSNWNESLTEGGTPGYENSVSIEDTTTTTTSTTSTSTTSTSTSSTTTTSTLTTIEAQCIVINEIMYKPTKNLGGPSNEWIELYNPADQPVNLTGWMIADPGNHSLDIENESNISSHGFFILAKKPDKFLENYNVSCPVVRVSFALNNNGEQIILRDSEGNVVDSVIYDKSWGADGNEKTLERINSTGNSSADNWAESQVEGGTPGERNSVSIEGPMVVLDYYVPSRIIANRSFKFAVKVKNEGSEQLKDFLLDSPQLNIRGKDNSSVNFTVNESFLTGNQREKSLNASFGDIHPGKSKFIRWSMDAEKDGNFSFNASHYYRDSSGKRKKISATIRIHILQREIHTGKKNDFLVDFDSDGIPDEIVESTYGNTTNISKVNCSIKRKLPPKGRRFSIEIKNKSGWIFIPVEDSYHNQVPVKKIVRGDGVVIHSNNYWLEDNKIYILNLTVDYSIA